MGIFDRLRKNFPAPVSTAAQVKADAKKTAPKELKESVVALPNVLLAPRVSEKAAILASRGTYVFNVRVSATKGDVATAVEKLYKVRVTSVRMVRNQGKVVRRGRVVGRRARSKKALVSLKKGQKLEIHEGV